MPVLAIRPFRSPVSLRLLGVLTVAVSAISAVRPAVVPEASPPTSAADNPAARARRIEQLMRLDDEQWKVVELLVSLEPGDWQALDAVVHQRAATGLPGRPLPPAQPQVDNLVDVVNTILARVNTIRSNLDSLSGRIPDRSDVRALLSQVDLDRLRELIGNSTDALQGLLDIARDLRDGYGSFDAAQFRVRLDGVLDDVESASTLYQRLLCLDDPDIQIRAVSTAPLKRLIDRAPGIALYTLSKLMEAIDPSWDQRIGAVVDAVPAELTGLCNEGRLAPPSLTLDATNVKCTALRRKDVGTGVAVVKAHVGVALMIFRYLKNHTEDEIAATLGANAVAGATAGAKVKNPVYETIEQWIDRLENIKDALSDVADQRKDCLDADKDIENDLRDCAKDDCLCSVPLSVLLQGAVSPTYAYVADLVAARITQAEDAGLPGTDVARMKHDQAVDTAHDETAAGYGLLCQAYKALLPSSQTSRFQVVPESPVLEGR